MEDLNCYRHFSCCMWSQLSEYQSSLSRIDLGMEEIGTLTAIWKTSWCSWCCCCSSNQRESCLACTRNLLVFWVTSWNLSIVWRYRRSSALFSDPVFRCLLQHECECVDESSRRLVEGIEQRINGGLIMWWCRVREIFFRNYNFWQKVTH